MQKLSDVSTYYLVLELMNNGDVGLLPELEPIPEPEIIEELEHRTQECSGSSKDKWAQWFLGAADHGSELERANFMMFLETRTMLSRSIEKVRIADQKGNSGQPMDKVTRVEVISQNGRDYVNLKCHSVMILAQDEGQTIKILLQNSDT